MPFWNEPFETSRHSPYRLPWWLFAGVAATLAIAVIVLAFRSNSREAKITVRNFVNRAEALMWALEAGTRLWMVNRGDCVVLQNLMEETARQPGIRYLAIIDKEGKIYAHNRKEMVGENFTVDLPDAWDKDEDIAWRVRERDGQHVFEVRKIFAPYEGDNAAFARGFRRGNIADSRGGGDGGAHGSGHGRGLGLGRLLGRRHSDEENSDSEPPGKSFIFIGLDNEPVAQILSGDYLHNILASALVAALGLGGVSSMFYLHNHRRTKRMLMDLRGLAREVVAGLPLGLIMRNHDGKIDMANAAALDILERKRDDVVGATLSDIPGLDWDDILAPALAGNRGHERELTLSRKSGPLSVTVSVAPLHSEDGLFLGHMVVLHNTQELQKLRQDMERNQRLVALGNMAAGVAHEVRNPLSSIKGLALLLATMAPKNGAGAKAAAALTNEADRLNRVVTELLNFARPGAVAFSRTDINEVVATALSLADADVRAKDITVDSQPLRGDSRVCVNREKLTQALLNVILNAIQASERGGAVEIAVASSDDRKTVSVIVRDHGHGMDEKTKPLIFTPYYTRRKTGTGLGLAIVYQIVELHGGRIDVASEPGFGTEIELTFPRRAELCKETEA